MAVASYTITNLTTSGAVQVGHVTLTTQSGTANIAYRSDDVEAAVTQGLITCTQIGSDAQTVLNLTAFIKELKSLPPQVVAL